MKINLPVMLLKRIVLLPHQDVRLDLNNDISNRVIDLAMKKHNGEILIVCPIDPYEEAPDLSDLPSVGVVGKIKSRLELPNGNLRLVVSGTKRVKILEYVNEIADGDILKAHIMEIDLPKFDEVEEITLRRKMLEILNLYIDTAPSMSNSVLSSVKDITDINILTDLIVPFMPFKIEKKLLYMQEINPLHRANALVYDLSIELQVAQLDEKLDDVLREDFERTQKEFVLREKMEAIKKELGETDLKDEVIDEGKPITLYHPIDNWKKTEVSNYYIEPLLKEIILNGKLVYKMPKVDEIVKRKKEKLSHFWDEYKRIERPHIYKVDLSNKLYEIKKEMMDSVIG